MPSGGSTCRDRCSRTWSRRRADVGSRRADLLPVPVLPDGAAHRPGPDADHPPPGRPRRARPPTCRSSRGCSAPPTGWSSRPSAERELVAAEVHRWRPITNSCSDWAWTTRTSPPTVLPGPDRPVAGHTGDPYLVCLGRVDRHKGTVAAGRPLRGRTSNATPAPSGWCWPARWSTHPRPIPTSMWSVRCRSRRSGPSSKVRWPWCPRLPGRPSPSWWPRRGARGTPVLVNAGCAATVEHCRRSGGGLSFAGFGEFEAELDRLLARRAAASARSAARGRAYVDRWFRWPRVIDRYATFVESVVAAA